MINILIITLAAVFCWFTCKQVRNRLLAASVMDTPNERSLHKTPVPRGGGIGIWFSLFPIWIIVDIINGHLAQHFFIMLGTACLIIVSWMDDKASLLARQRFMVHLVAVVCGLISLPIHQFVFQGVFPLWLDRAVAGFAWLWFINLTNFMDGIDGISGAQTAHISLSFIIITLLSSFLPQDTVLAACLLGGAIGFLMWNWHPAKLFLGDVGSIPIGFLLGYLMMVLAVNGYLGIALTLPLYYVADSTITLLRRLAEKKKFWEAHREHFYQKSALVVGHLKTLKPIMLTNVGLLLISVLSLQLSPWLLLLAPLLVAGLLWYLNKQATQDNLKIHATF
jgi:UDP-N-acetylmuramyl pentapeptide phosphotransferase/UDP-N-acetylglucosamine-1-phosphate transferase